MADTHTHTASSTPAPSTNSQNCWAKQNVKQLNTDFQDLFIMEQGREEGEEKRKQEEKREEEMLIFPGAPKTG